MFVHNQVLNIFIELNDLSAVAVVAGVASKIISILPYCGRDHDQMNPM